MAEDDGLLARVVGRLPAVLGAGLAAAVGAHSGDPVTGAMVGEAFAQLGEDFVQRVLSPRQEARVAKVLNFASQAVVTGLAEGRMIRDDGFFDASHLDATEAFEGVLLAARDEYEEKKLPYMAYLLADIAFDPQLIPEVANLAIREAERISWLELCLVAIVSRPDEFPLPDMEIESPTGETWGQWAVSQTFMDMGNDGGLLFNQQSTSPRRIPTYDLRLSAYRLTNRAQLIADSMRLDTMPAGELQATYETLLETARQYGEQSETGSDD